MCVSNSTIYQSTSTTRTRRTLFVFNQPLNNWNVSNDVRKVRRMFYGEQRRLEPEEGVAHDVAKKNNSSGFATRKRRGTS